jgi:transcriptional regulator with XRE-family HTH domain
LEKGIGQGAVLMECHGPRLVQNVREDHAAHRVNPDEQAPRVMIEANLGNAVRRLRESHHLSLRALAEKTGFSPGFISQVENGQASPSISSMERIAAALGVTLGEFFRWTESKPLLVTRAESRPGLNSEWSKAKIEALGPSGGENKIEVVMVTLYPGGTSAKRPHSKPHDEFAIIFSGAVTLTLGDGTEMVLETGDAVSIRAGLPRRWENANAEEAKVVIVTAVSAAPP